MTGWTSLVGNEDEAGVRKLIRFRDPWQVKYGALLPSLLEWAQRCQGET